MTNVHWFIQLGIAAVQSAIFFCVGRIVERSKQSSPLVRAVKESQEHVARCKRCTEAHLMRHSATPLTEQQAFDRMCLEGKLRILHYHLEAGLVSSGTAIRTKALYEKLENETVQ